MSTTYGEMGQQSVGGTWWQITLIVFAAHVELDGGFQQPVRSLHFGVARLLSPAFVPGETKREIQQ